MFLRAVLRPVVRSGDRFELLISCHWINFLIFQTAPAFPDFHRPQPNHQIRHQPQLPKTISPSTSQTLSRRRRSCASCAKPASFLTTKTWRCCRNFNRPILERFMVDTLLDCASSSRRRSRERLWRLKRVPWWASITKVSREFDSFKLYLNFEIFQMWHS